MKLFQGIALVAGLAGLAQAHMEMTYPPPFKSKANPYSGENIDYSMTSPLDSSGDNFPCKGYQSLLGSEAGQSVATFAAGSQYNMTFSGSANHGGGSCQASLSFDKGKTFRVIHSYIGNCPVSGVSSLDFKIPPNTPSGEVLFAWTWFNRIGNREMYMNCAAVTITGGSSSKRDVSALSDHPTIYVANVMGSTGCTTTANLDVTFPYPGQDVTNESTQTEKYVPTCGGGSPGSGSGSDDSSSSAVEPSDVASTAAPTSTQPAASSAAPTSVPGGVFITVSDPADGSSATSASDTSVVATSAPAATFSTLITVTKSAGSDSSSPVATPSSPTSAAQATPTSGSGGDSSGSGEAFTAGTACDNEGEWNCVGTTQFQRCASGQWSVLMAVAAGTKCDSSNTSELTISSINKKRRAFRRNE